MSSSAQVLQRRARPAPSRWPRAAVTAVFVVHGLLFASWTAHIPHVMRHLGLTDGSLGIALLGAPVGSVTAMLLASYLIPRVGSRRVVQTALVGYCATGPLVGLTGSLAALFAALFVWGAFQGTLDVAMNTQAIAVERAGRRALMSGLHGSWSIGSFAGAGIGALAVSAGLGLTPQLLVLGTVALLAAGLLTSRMLPDAMGQASITERAADDIRPASRWSGGMILLGAIAFAGMLCEGASADWASVYLSGPLHATGAVPGLGYAAFALAMVIVRLSGNRLLRRFTPSHLVSALAAVATAGFAAGLALGAGRRDRGLRLPGYRPGLRGTRRLQRRGPHPGASPRQGRRDGVGLRLGRVRVRSTADRAPGLGRLPPAGARAAAFPDGVGGRGCFSVAGLAGCSTRRGQPG